MQFIKILGILSDRGDEKESFEIAPDVIKFEDEKMKQIFTKELPEINFEKTTSIILNSLTIDTNMLSYKYKDDIPNDLKTIPIWEREHRPDRFEIKPLLKVENYYIFSPIICFQTLALWTNGFEGLYPIHEQGIPNILEEIENEKKTTQDDMVQSIAKLFRDVGIKTVFVELKLHKHGNHPNFLGDYDILAIDTTNNKIWNIESKVLQHVGSISEFAKHQLNFFINDKKDSKFQRRINYLISNVETILKDLKIDSSHPFILEHIMVTNKVFVSEFKQINFPIISYYELKNLIIHSYPQ